MEQKQQERILVCLSSAPSNANIIRTGAKMAAAFGGSLTALYVQTLNREQLGPENRQRLQSHIRLAESLGAVITTVSGEDVAFQIAEFARLSGVTKVILGRSGMGRRLFGEKPLTERLIALAPNLNIYIIPDTAGENRSHHKPVQRLLTLPSLAQWGICAGVLVMTTVIGLGFQALRFTEANIITVYLLGLLLVSLFTRNYACSGLSALGSVLLFNFFFTEPRLTFHAYESGYPVTFAIMLIAGLLTGTLANQLSRQAQQSAQAAYRTQVLLETNQLLQKAGDDGEILTLTAQQLEKLLNRSILLWPGEGGRLGNARTFGTEGFAGEEEIARWVLENCRRAGAGTEEFPNAQGLYLAIRSQGEAFGVVGIDLKEWPLEPFESSVVLSILGESALTMERNRSAREKEAAAVLAKNEQLRADLLRAISHDLRTPLTAISGNAENLLVNDAFLDPESRRAVLTDIYDDGIWLIQLVENLLSITRIGDGRMQLNLSAQLVDEVVAEALSHAGRKAAEHSITTDLGEELLLGTMDARLISQVIVNLVDNAIKYTPAGSQIRVSARRQGDRIAICICDNGPGIPAEQKQHVFEMFYTGNTRVADQRKSLGLGLALCRSIVNAHGGELTLTDNCPQGSIFTFTIPASEVTINE